MWQIKNNNNNNLLIFHRSFAGNRLLNAMKFFFKLKRKNLVSLTNTNF